IDPRDAGDEAVRLDGAQDGSRLRIDLVDLPLPVLSDPERSLCPGQARVAPTSRSGDRREHLSGARVDLLDPRVGDLPEVLPVERGARIAGALEGAATLAGRRIERAQRVPAREPDQASVEADPGHVGDAGERPVLPDDLRFLLALRHGNLLAESLRAG